jgi:hypothetical protein
MFAALPTQKGESKMTPPSAMKPMYLQTQPTVSRNAVDGGSSIVMGIVRSEPNLSHTEETRSSTRVRGYLATVLADTFSRGLFGGGRLRTLPDGFLIRGVNQWLDPSALAAKPPGCASLAADRFVSL